VKSYRIASVALTGIIVSTFAAAQDVKGTRELQGKWQAVELETEGQPQDAKAVKAFKVGVFGDQMFFRASGTVSRRATFKLDPSTSPHTITLTLVEGETPTRTVTGIYAVENGRWKLCFPNFDQQTKMPPREFKTRRNDGLILLVLARAMGK